MQSLSLVRYMEATPLFTVQDLKDRYGRNSSERTILNVLHRLKKQGRVQAVARGVYAGASASAPLNRYVVPRHVREDAVIACHSALEFHGVANQVFQTVYYFSAQHRRDVVFGDVVYHRVAPPRLLRRSGKLGFQVEQAADKVRVTRRERSFVDCLLFQEFGGGPGELDKCLAMFPSFDFGLALEYLTVLRRPWLYARVGFLLDRHADRLFFSGKHRDAFLARRPRGVAYLERKRPGFRWVETWNLMVPETLLSSPEAGARS
jgi:predicted transcriptional regulator of viral defense system